MPRTATATPRRHQHVNIDGHRVHRSSTKKRHPTTTTNTSADNNNHGSSTTAACGGGDGGPASIVVEARVHSVGLSDTSLTFLIDQVVLEGLVSLESGVDTTLQALYGSGILDYKPLCAEASSLAMGISGNTNNQNGVAGTEFSPFTTTSKNSTSRPLDPISCLSPRLAHHQYVIAQEVKKWEQIISYPYESRLKPLLEKQQERLRRWRQKRELMSPLLDNNNAAASISTSSSDDDGDINDNNNNTQSGGQNPPLYQTYSSATRRNGNHNGSGGGGMRMGARRLSASSLSSRSDDDNKMMMSAGTTTTPTTTSDTDNNNNSTTTTKREKIGVACQDSTVLTNHVVVGIKTVFSPEGCATASTSTDETFFLLDRRDIVRLLNTKGDSSRRDVAEKYSEILDGLMSSSANLAATPLSTTTTSTSTGSAPTTTSAPSSTHTQPPPPPLLPQEIDIGYTDSLLFSFPSNITNPATVANNNSKQQGSHLAADPTISISVRACVYVVPVEFPSVERQEHFAQNRRNNHNNNSIIVDPTATTTASFPKFKKRTLLVQNRLDSLVAFLDAASRRGGGDSIRTSNVITLPSLENNENTEKKNNNNHKNSDENNVVEKSINQRKATMIAVGSSTETYRDLYLLQHSSAVAAANHHHHQSSSDNNNNGSGSGAQRSDLVPPTETVEPIVAGAAGRTAIGPYVRTVFMDIHDNDDENKMTDESSSPTSPSSQTTQKQRKTPTLLFSNVAGHAHTLVPLLNVHRLRAAYGVQHHLTTSSSPHGGDGWTPSLGASPVVSPRPTTAGDGRGGGGATPPRKSASTIKSPRRRGGGRGDDGDESNIIIESGGGGQRASSSTIPSTAATAPLIEFETLSSLLSSLTPSNPPVVIASLDVPISSIVGGGGGSNGGMLIPSSSSHQQQQQGKRQPPALIRLRDTEAVVVENDEDDIFGQVTNKNNNFDDGEDLSGLRGGSSSRISSSSFASSSIMPTNNNNKNGISQQQQQNENNEEIKGKYSAHHNHTSTSACMLLQASCWWTQHGAAAPTSMTQLSNGDQNTHRKKSSKKSSSVTTTTPRRGEANGLSSAAPSATPLLAADYDSFVEFVASEQSEYLRQKGITSSAVPNPDDNNSSSQTPRGRNHMLLSSSFNHHDRHDPNPLIGGRASDRLQQQQHSSRSGGSSSLSSSAPGGSVGSFHGALNTFNVFCLLSVVEAISFLRLAWRQKPLQLLCVTVLIMSSMLLLPLSASVVSLPHQDDASINHHNHHHHYLYKSEDQSTTTTTTTVAPHSYHDSNHLQEPSHSSHFDDTEGDTTASSSSSKDEESIEGQHQQDDGVDEAASTDNLYTFITSNAQALLLYMHVLASCLCALSSNIWLTRVAMIIVGILSFYLLLYKRWLGNTWIAAQRLQEYAIAGQKHQYRQRRLRLSTVLFDEFETAGNLAALYRQFKTEEKFRRRQARGHNHDLDTTRVTTVEDATFALTTFLENRMYPEMHLPDYDLLSGLPATYTLPPPSSHQHRHHQQHTTSSSKNVLPHTSLMGTKSVVSEGDEHSRSNQPHGGGGNSSSSPAPRIPDQFVAFPPDQFSDEGLNEGSPDPQQQKRMMRDTIVTTGFTSPLDVPGVVETDPQTARDSEKWISKHHTNGSRSGGSLTATSTPAADSWGLFRQCSGGMTHHVIYDPYSTTTALQINKKRACAPLLEYLQFSEHLRFVPCTDPLRTSHTGNIAAEQYLHPSKRFIHHQQGNDGSNNGRWLAARRGLLVAPHATHIGTSASTPLPLLSSTSNVRGDETNFLIHATFYDLLLYLETWLRRCAASYRTQSSTFVHSTVGHTCRQVTPWLPRRWLISGRLAAMALFRSNSSTNAAANSCLLNNSNKKGGKRHDNDRGMGLAGIPDAPQISFVMLLVATIVCLFLTSTVTEDLLKGRLEPMALSIREEWGMMMATSQNDSNTTSTSSGGNDNDEDLTTTITTTASTDLSFKMLITAITTLWSEAGVLVADNAVFGLGYDKIVENDEVVQKSNNKNGGNDEEYSQSSSSTSALTQTDEQLLDTLFDGPSSSPASQNNKKENDNKNEANNADYQKNENVATESKKLDASLGIDMTDDIITSMSQTQSSSSDEKRENSEALMKLSTSTAAASESSLSSSATSSTARTLVKNIFSSIFGTTAYSISFTMHVTVFFIKTADAFIISPTTQFISQVGSAFNVEVAQFIVSEKHQAELQARALSICQIHREQGETKASVSTRWGRFMKMVTEIVLQQEYHQNNGAEDYLTSDSTTASAESSHTTTHNIVNNNNSPVPSTPRRLMRSGIYLQLFVVDVSSRSVLFMGRLLTVVLGSFVSPPVRYSITNLLPHVQYTTEMVPANIIPVVSVIDNPIHHHGSSSSSPLDEEANIDESTSQHQHHATMYRCSVARLCIFGLPLNSIHFDFLPITMMEGGVGKEEGSPAGNVEQRRQNSSSNTTPSSPPTVNDDSGTTTTSSSTTYNPSLSAAPSSSAASVIAVWAGEFVPSWALVSPCSSSPYALAGPLFCWELEIFLRVWITAVVLGTLLVFPVTEYCKRVGNSIRVCRELADQVLGFSHTNNNGTTENSPSSRHDNTKKRRRRRSSSSLLIRLLHLTQNYFRVVASYIIAPLVALTLFHAMFCSQLLVRMVIGPMFWKIVWPFVKAVVGWIAGTTPLEDPNNFSDETDLRFAAPVFGNHLLTMAKGQKQFRTHAFHPLVSFTLDSTVLLREGTYHDQLAHRLNITATPNGESDDDCGEDEMNTPHRSRTTTTTTKRRDDESPSSSSSPVRKSQNKNNRDSSPSVGSIIQLLVIGIPYKMVVLLQRVMVAFLEAVSSIRYETRLLSEPLPLEGHNTLLTTNQQHALHRCMTHSGTRCPTLCLFASASSKKQQQNGENVGNGPQPLLSTTIQRKMLASSRSSPSYLWYDRLSRHWRATASPSLSGSSDFDMSELRKNLQKAADGKISGITEHSPLLLFNQYGKGYIGPLQFYYRSLSEVKSYSLADWTMRQIAAANLIVSLQADSRQTTVGGGVSSSLQYQQQQAAAPMMAYNMNGGLLPPLSPIPPHQYQQQQHPPTTDHQSIHVSASSGVGGAGEHGWGEGLISSDDGSPVQHRNVTRPQSPLHNSNNHLGDAPTTTTTPVAATTADHHHTQHPTSMVSRFASRLVSLANPHQSHEVDDPSSPIIPSNSQQPNNNDTTIHNGTLLSNRGGGGTINGGGGTFGGGGPPRRWREQLRLLQQNQSGSGDYVQQQQQPIIPSTPAAYNILVSRGANGTPITPPSAFDDNSYNHNFYNLSALHQRSDSNLSQLNLHRQLQQQQQTSATSRRPTRTKLNGADDISSRFLSALSGGGGVSSIGNRAQQQHNSNNNSSGNEHQQKVSTPQHPHTPYLATPATPAPPPLSTFSRSTLAHSTTDAGVGGALNPSGSIIRRRNLNHQNNNNGEGGVIPSSALLGGGGGPIGPRDHENLWQRAPEMASVGGGASVATPTSSMLNHRLSIAASMPSLYRQTTAPPPGGGGSTSPENPNNHNNNGSSNNSPLTDPNSLSNSSRKVIENSNKLTVPSPTVVRRPSPTTSTTYTGGGPSFSVSLASAPPSSRHRRSSIPPPPNLSFSTTASSHRPTATIIDSTRGGPLPRGSTSPLEPATPLHAHTAATPPPTKTKSPTSTSLQSHKTVTLKQQLQQPNSRSSRGSVVSAADDRSGEFTNNGDGVSDNNADDSPLGRYNNNRVRNDSLASDVRFNSTGVFSNNGNNNNRR